MPKAYSHGTRRYNWTIATVGKFQRKWRGVAKIETIDAWLTSIGCKQAFVSIYVMENCNSHLVRSYTHLGK